MKMAQVTIRTAVFDKEVSFYRDVVGLKTVHELQEGLLHIVFLSNGEGETCIEVIDQSDAGKTCNPYLSIGFRRADATRLRQELMQKGYEPTPMESPAPAVQFFFVKDPAGVAVQFVEGGF